MTHNIPTAPANIIDARKKENVDPFAKPWHTEMTRGRCAAVSATGYTVFRGDLDVASTPVEYAVRCANACADFVNPEELRDIVDMLKRDVRAGVLGQRTDFVCGGAIIELLARLDNHQCDNDWMAGNSKPRM